MDENEYCEDYLKYRKEQEPVLAAPRENYDVNRLDLTDLDKEMLRGMKVGF